MKIVNINILTTGVFLLLLSLVGAIPFQDDYEYVYSYQGDLITGVKEPNEYISYTRINADVHVVPIDKKLWIEMKNVNYTAYSGNAAEDESKSVPVNEDSKIIMLPFVYLKYGNISSDGIFVHRDDEPWSINIKQAVANLLYLNKRVFAVDQYETFNTGYGLNRFEYYVLAHNDEVRITRVMTGDLYKYPKNDNLHNNNHRQLPIVKKQIYDMERKDGQFILKTISAESNVDFHPFDGDGAKIFAFVNQTFQLKYKNTAGKKEIETLSEYKEIVFDLNTYQTESGAYDITTGRHAIDMNQLVTTLKEDLVNIEKSINDVEITLMKTVLNNRDRVDLIVSRLQQLDKEHTQKLHAELSNLTDANKVLDLFLKLLSLTGTPSSYSFVIDFILQKKIEDDLAVTLLQNMPNHILKFPTQLQVQFSELLKKDTSEQLKHQAILTLTSIISVAIKKHGDDSHLYDGFVKQFIAKLKNYDDDLEQFVYLNALRNIKTEKSNEVLKRIAKNVNSLTPHLRATAMLGLERGPEQDQLLWLLFTNKTEDFEIKATAMRMLMDPKYPEHLEKVFWTTFKDDDSETHNLLYTTLKSLSQTALPQFEVSSRLAKKLLPYLERKKVFVKSSNYLFDYVDQNFGFGAMAQFAYYGNLGKHNFSMYHVQLSQKTLGPVWSNDEHYLYLRWNSTLDKKFTNIIDEVLKIDMPVFVEWVTCRNGQVTSIVSFRDMTTLKNKIKNFFERDRTTELNVDQVKYTEIPITTDIGIPLVFSNQMAYLRTITKELPRRELFNILFDVNCRGNAIYGFRSYNPIIRSWNGVERVHTLNVAIPINLDLEASPNLELQFTYTIPKLAFGFESFVYSHVFIKDESNGTFIKDSCSQCQPSVMTVGEDDLENFVFFESNKDNLGLQYKMMIHSSDDHMTSSYPVQLMQIFTDYNMNFESYPLLKPLIGAYHVWNYITLFPGRAMQGFGLKIENSKLHPITHIDFVVGKTRESQTMNNANDTLATKTVFNMTTNILNGNELLYYWSIGYTSYVIPLLRREIEFYTTWNNSGVPYKFEFGYASTRKRNFTNVEMVFQKNEIDNPTNDLLVIISGQLKMSKEQENDNELENALEVCIENPDEQFLKCLLDVSTYRFFNFEIENKKMKDEDLSYLMKIKDFIRLAYGDEFIRMPRPELGKTKTEIMVTRPMYRDTLNVSVTTENEAFRYDDVDVSNWNWIPDIGTGYLSVFYGYCEVGLDYIRDAEEGDKFNLTYTDDWTRLIEESSIFHPSTWDVNIKKDKSDHLILQMRAYNDVIEVSYGTDIEIRLNDEPQNLENKYYSSTWFEIISLGNDNTKQTIIHMKNTFISILYNHDLVKLVIPSTVPKGKCIIRTLYDKI